jgi:hypothetical protein
MHKQKLKTWLSLAVIVAAAIFFYLRAFERGPDFELRPHLALGEALADLAGKSAVRGGRITLIAPDPSIGKWPAVEAQLKGFYRGLRRANVQLSATNLIKLDPIRLARVPSQEFMKMIRKQSDADLIVSLLGPPIPTPEERAQLPAKHARVIASCTGELPRQVNLKSLFEGQLLEAAIISRQPPGGVPRTDYLPDWFASYFEVITARNLANLPSPAPNAAR